VIALTSFTEDDKVFLGHPGRRCELPVENTPDALADAIRASLKARLPDITVNSCSR
jgi:hypothetical protein